MCVCKRHCQSGNEDPSQSPPQFHAKFTGSDTHAHTLIHTYWDTEVFQAHRSPWQPDHLLMATFPDTHALRRLAHCVPVHACVGVSGFCLCDVYKCFSQLRLHVGVRCFFANVFLWLLCSAECVLSWAYRGAFWVGHRWIVIHDSLPTECGRERSVCAGVGGVCEIGLLSGWIFHQHPPEFLHYIHSSSPSHTHTRTQLVKVFQSTV